MSQTYKAVAYVYTPPSAPHKPPIQLNLSLTEGQINAVLEGVGKAYNIPLFAEGDLNRLVTTSREWEAAVKKLQSLAPIFSQYNLEGTEENMPALVDKVTTSKKLVDALTVMLASLNLPLNSESIAKLGLFSNECTVDYTAPFPRDLYLLDRVLTLRPEYLVGTWFNRQERPFKLNMDFDWVNRTSYVQPSAPMNIWFFASTGEHIWDFIDEVHIHNSAMMKFTVPRDGWIETPPAANVWDYIKDCHALDFIEGMMKVKGGKTIVQLHGGTGGWATFEHARNHEVTAAAARLLFKFSDPLYCARADGKVVIKLKNIPSTRATLRDITMFPATRTLVNDQIIFPHSIQ